MIVEKHLPSEVKKHIKRQGSPYTRLILTGYDTREMDRRDPYGLVRSEYNYDDDEAVIFLACVEEEIVGSLTLINYFSDTYRKFGVLFFEQLKNLNPLLHSRVVSSELPVSVVGGIVVDPQHRQIGIGRALLSSAITELNPVIITGQTKTPSAVQLRSYLPGYRSFFGSTELTSKKSILSSNYLAVHTAVRHAYKIHREQPEGLVHLTGSFIRPTIPNTEKFPERVQEAFLPVIKAQTRIGTHAETVMAFLVSIKQEFLED